MCRMSIQPSREILPKHYLHVDPVVASVGQFVTGSLVLCISSTLISTSLSMAVATRRKKGNDGIVACACNCWGGHVLLYAFKSSSFGSLGRRSMSWRKRSSISLLSWAKTMSRLKSSLIRLTM